MYCKQASMGGCATSSDKALPFCRPMACSDVFNTVPCLLGAATETLRSQKPPQMTPAQQTQDSAQARQLLRDASP